MIIQSPPSFHDAQILLIEDNDADARLVIESMKTGKLVNAVVRVNNGEQALDYLHKRGDYKDAVRPDLILLDLNMPRMDGREFMESIKDQPTFTNIPLVVLTTSNDNTDIESSYQNLANCYITKPIDFAKFVEVVQSIEKFWLQIAKIP